VDQAKRAAVQYFGDRERQELISTIVGDAVDRQLADSFLSAGTVGANRNFGLLATAGTPVLMSDDDMVWKPWRFAHAGTDVVFAGHGDRRDCLFFESRAESLEGLECDPHADLLAIHESLLGRLGSSLVIGAPDFTETCAHLLYALDEQSDVRVRVSMTGVAGDSGVYCPYGLLFCEGPTRAELLRGSDVLFLALRSREVRRATLRPVVTHDPHCMCGCAGLANDELLPPFLPIGCNEDGVFGALLAFADHDALFGHVPWGIVHDSPRPSIRAGGILSATRTRLSDLVIALIRHASRTIPAAPPRCRLQRLAAVVAEMAQMRDGSFRELLVTLVLEGRRGQLIGLDKQANDSSCPDYWRAAIGSYRQALLDGLACPEFYCPIEFSSCGLQLGCRSTQTFLRGLGVFIAAWPDLWERAQGVRMGMTGAV
jgi:hypothetical protein